MICDCGLLLLYAADDVLRVQVNITSHDNRIYLNSNKLIWSRKLIHSQINRDQSDNYNYHKTNFFVFH